MSSQGTGYPSQHHGMKNTSDPLAKQEINESAGPVASDSLAAESYNAGGSFSDNANAAPSGVSGSSSTFNTTDTSSARTLDATEDRANRDDGYTDAEKGPAGVRYAEGLGGQPDFPGATTAAGYSGGPSKGYNSSGFDSSDSTSRDTSGSAGQGFSQGGFQKSSNSDSTSNSRGGDYSSSGNTSSNVDAAPTYVADVYLGDKEKPKGSNITEDPNMDGDRKTDFEIGSENDPARANVQKFADAPATGQVGGRQTQVDGDNSYSELRDTSA